MSLEVKELAEFDCPLCQSLLYEPVTTSCGHNFCKSCIVRALDHNNKCPMCRAIIQVSAEQPVNVLLQTIIKKNFAKEYSQRKEEVEQQVSEHRQNLPLFILDMVLFPNMQLPLHVFEPRYRLLLRRCLEGTRRFGILSVTNGNLSKMGTTAVINNHVKLPDGRSLVNTTGERRFRVLDSWEQDGYKVAKVELIPDEDAGDLQPLSEPVSTRSSTSSITSTNTTSSTTSTASSSTSSSPSNPVSSMNLSHNPTSTPAPAASASTNAPTLTPPSSSSSNNSSSSTTNPPTSSSTATCTEKSGSSVIAVPALPMPTQMPPPLSPYHPRASDCISPTFTTADDLSHAATANHHLRLVSPAGSPAPTSASQHAGGNSAPPSAASADALASPMSVDTDDAVKLMKDLQALLDVRLKDIKKEVADKYGEMPRDTPLRFSFWLAALLPVSTAQKQQLLECKTALERLRLARSMLAVPELTNTCVVQ